MLTKVCSHCGGENVLRDAFAEWDVPQQKWVLQNLFDESFCEDCDGSTTIRDGNLEICDE